MNPTSLSFPRELQNNFKKKKKKSEHQPPTYTLACYAASHVLNVGGRLPVPKGKQGTVKWPKENARECENGPSEGLNAIQRHLFSL